MDIKTAIQNLKEKFTSGNNLQVQRATILREEWEAIYSYTKEQPAIPQQPQGKICPQCLGAGLLKVLHGVEKVNMYCGICNGTGKLSPVA